MVEDAAALGGANSASSASSRLRTGSQTIRVDGVAVVKGGDDRALDIVVREMDKNESIAQFQEVKVSTEIQLGLF